MFDDLRKLQKFFRVINPSAEGLKTPEVPEMIEISPGTWVPAVKVSAEAAEELRNTGNKVLDGLENFQRAVNRMKTEE